MQVLAVIGKLLLAALAASAAKLPLPVQPSTLYEAPIGDLPVPAQTALTPAEISQVPVVVPQVTPIVLQVPEVPSTLYGPPVHDLPPQSSIQVQSSGSQTPAHQTGVVHTQIGTGSDASPHVAPSTNLGLPSQIAVSAEATAQQPNLAHSSSIQIPTGIPQVPVEVSQVQSGSPQTPAVLSTLYETPVHDLPSQSSIQVQSSGLQVPVHQTSVTHGQIGTGSHVLDHAVPSTSFGLPSQVPQVPDSHSAGTVFVPGDISLQQSSLAHTSQDITAGSSDQTAHHTSLGSSVQITGEPAIPSTLYDAPEQETLTPIHQSPSTPIGVSSIPLPVQHTPVKPISAVQDIPASDEQNVLLVAQDDIVPVPNEPSTLYSAPELGFQLPSQISQTSSGALPEQIESVSQFGIPADTPAVIIVEESSDPLVPVESAEIYDAPEQAFPVQADSSLSLVQSGAVLPGNEEAFPVQSTFQGSGQAITFPDQAPSVLIPVPPVPSTLYETPVIPAPSGLYETPLLAAPSTSHEAQVPSGKAMAVENQQQNIIQEPSSLYEVPAASEIVAAVAKQGGMMMGMPYDFQWGVDDDESGSVFTHVEESDGKTTRGQYKVTLPDGRIQVVNFYDNGDGFNAEISYE